MDNYISSKQSLAALLRNKPSRWAFALAYRSAIRAFPLSLRPDSWEEGVINPRGVLDVLAALTVSFAATQIDEVDFSRASTRLSSRAEYAGDDSGICAFFDVAYSASWTVDLANPSYPDFSHALAGSSAVGEAANAAEIVSADSKDDLWKVASKEYDLLEEGIEYLELMGRSFRHESPDWLRAEWVNATKWLSLPSDKFVIWREWYYGRIEGLPHAFADFDDAADQKFYRWIVEHDNDWWSRQPAEVNRDITDFVDALRRRPPTDEELQQNPRAFTFSLDAQGRSDLDDDHLPNGLQGDADERDNHSEILRLLDMALLATAGDTNAKDMDDPTHLLRDAVGEQVEDLRPRFFILRARELIRQVEERESGDSLNPQLSEKQRDAYLPLVAALKMIAEFSPKLAELWHGKLGRTGPPLTREMLDLVAQALRNSGQTTALAQAVIEASNRQVLPDAPEDDPARVAASETSRNVVRKIGGTLKKAGDNAKSAENVISLGERAVKLWGALRGKLPDGETIARILSHFGGG